ncbi:MAG: hypothetical protein RSE58_14145, partial [Clostridia bacterium]
LPLKTASDEDRALMEAVMRLPRLENKPDFERDVLRQVRGEVKVKKKLSVGLVVAIILLMLTLSALAATLLWENYAGELMQQERQIGTYASWQASDKELLIKAMVDMNYMEVTPKIEKLFDASTSEGEKSALSDQVLLAFLEQNKNLQNHSTSFNGEVSSITSGLLTLAVMGAEETWPAEKRVWWQRLTNPRVK